MKKISRKISLTFILCSLLVVAIVSTSFYLISRKILRIEAEKNLLNLVQIEANIMDDEFKNYKLLAENLKAVIETTVDISSIDNNQMAIDLYENSVSTSVKEIIKVFNGKTGWIVFNSEEVPAGNTVSFTTDDSGSYIRDKEYDAIEDGYSHDAWWKVAIEKGSNWTDPYYWEDWDANVMTYSVPVIVDERVIGVAGTEIFYDSLQKRIKEIAVYESGYLTLMNSNFDFLYHPDSSLKNLKTIADGKFQPLVARMMSADHGMTYYSGSNGENKVLAWKKLSNGWILTANPEESEMFAGLNEVKRTIVMLSIAVIIFALLVGFVLAQSIVKPINGMLQVVVSLSQFDLRTDMSSTLTKRKDELGIIANAIQSIKVNMYELIKEIKKTAEDVAGSSTILAETALVATNTTREIADSVHEISKGATEQAENTTMGAEKLIQLGNMIEKTKSHVNDLDESTQVVSDLVSSGLQNIDGLIGKTVENQLSVNEVSKSIKQTNNSANKINDASTLITSIAEQSSLGNS